VVETTYLCLSIILSAFEYSASRLAQLGFVGLFERMLPNEM